MTNAAAASAPSHPGLFARVWAMLSQLMRMVFASQAELDDHLAAIDAELARAMLAEVRAQDPGLAGLPDDALRVVWRGGRLDFEWVEARVAADEPAPPITRADWLRFIAARRRFRQLHRGLTLRGAGFPLHGTTRSRLRFERRNARRRRLSITTIAADAPHLAPTPITAPP